MLRLMASLEINMDIGALHVRQALQLHLKFLSDVVRVAQGFVRVHYDVDFDDDARSAVVGPHGIDAGDHWGMCHRLVVVK